MSRNGDVSVDPVTATKSNSNLSEGGNQVRNDNQGTNRTITEVPPGVRIKVDPAYGETDTIKTEQGRVERQRSQETGIVLKNNID